MVVPDPFVRGWGGNGHVTWVWTIRRDRGFVGKVSVLLWRRQEKRQPHFCLWKLSCLGVTSGPGTEELNNFLNWGRRQYWKCKVEKWKGIGHLIQLSAANSELLPNSQTYPLLDLLLPFQIIEVSVNWHILLFASKDTLIYISYYLLSLPLLIKNITGVGSVSYLCLYLYS